MIRNAIIQAKRSKFERARVGAVICNGKRIVSSGFNSINRHQFLVVSAWRGSIHAEQAAIGKLLQKNKHKELKGATIYIARIGNSGNLYSNLCSSGNRNFGNYRISKPCSRCFDLIKKVGIKKVVYTTNNGVESYRV